MSSLSYTGVDLEVPGQKEAITFKGWLFSFVGDAPAVAEIVGTKKSFSKSKNICNLCENAHRDPRTGVGNVRKYSAFLRCSCVDDRNHDSGCLGTFALRTKARDAVHQQTADARKMKDLGVLTWEHAFVRVPDGGRSLAQQPGPKDAMHVWLEGLIKSHAAATVFMIVRVMGWCTKDQLINRSKRFDWPKEKSLSRPGYLSEKLFKGTGSQTARGNSSDFQKDITRPLQTTHMPFTAHHMLVWALHSIELLRPFLPPDAMQYKFWRAWVLEVCS